MSKDILKEKIALELKRCDEFLEAAKSMIGGKFYSSAVSRAYYAVLHSARALLLIVDIEPTTHAGAVSMFGLHFVKTKEIEKKYGKIFKNLKEERETGDYDITSEFGEDDAKEAIKEAEEFSAQMKAYLKSKDLKG